ncbi:serine/threonine protein kinase [Arthrobacter sp. N1]|uniref:serine/threonine protein kinase n=1 Tax=Arthrobacter sp. N1 TaxID=619291 RepID=UPI003BAE33A4
MDDPTSCPPSPDPDADGTARLRQDDPWPHDEPARPVVAGLSVGRLLGRGGASVVWQVTDAAGLSFALKVPMTPSDVGEPSRTSPCPEDAGAAVEAGGGRRGERPNRRARAGSGGSAGLPPRSLVGDAAAPSASSSPARRGRRSAGTSPSMSAVRRAPAPAELPTSVSEEPTKLFGRATEAPSARRMAGTPPGADGLARELALLQRFTHDHLLRVHRIVPTDQGPALLAELAAGGSILALVAGRGPLPIPEVVTSLVPIAHVLQYLHDAGAVHGDVTPGNILFSHEGKPVLADLGTGQLLGTDASMSRGTPGFIDPSGGGGFDPGADVFALAAVSWFAMTGRIPGPTEQRPPLSLMVPEVPAPLMHLIEDGLSTDRRRRPTAEQFARTLLSSAAARPVDLVPAVHPSVLPELLTRRASVPSDRKPTGWRRLVAVLRPAWGRGAPQAGARRAPGEQRIAGPGTPRPGAGRAPIRALRARAGGRAAVAVRPGSLIAPGVASGARGGAALVGRPATGSLGSLRSRPRDGRDGILRGRAALVAGVLALALLVAGLALTVSGPLRPGVLSAPATVTADTPGWGGGEARTKDGPEAGGSGRSPGTGATREDGGAPGTGSDQGREEGADEEEIDDQVGEGDPGRGALEAADPRVPGLDGPAGEDPLIALGDLAHLRAEAFATADPSLLSRIDVEGSPAMTADREAVESLATSGITFPGLTISIREPRALTGDEQAAMTALADSPAVGDAPSGTTVSLVRATAALSSYTEERTVPADERGSPSLMAAGRQDMIFVLWNSGGGWRIHSTIEPPA